MPSVSRSRRFATCWAIAATLSFVLSLTGNLLADHHNEVDIHDSSVAVKNLDVHEDLEATLFASEPTILSPTNLDVDARGRVWVCEVVNYRRHREKRPEGDRILILEDSDGDGVSDTTKVFYQGRDIDSAMGICVLGSRIIVSCSPNVIVFHDDDGDDKPDRQEVLFTKTGIPQHDHSAHSFVFGPDGKLYWNQGNTGKHVHDRDGNPVVDVFGHEVIANGNPYRQGLVFRCNMDGSEFEVLGHNFRNNYEATVDSFGGVWQSDNDDDGNRGTRINFVMEYGNYGYTDEMTGDRWGSPRTGMHQEIPLRHWHLRDPGVVPNMLQTGAGSPTGITVYEGELLPAVFRGQVIHCEPGKSVVRAYPATRDGAGYQARTVNILKGTRNQWFRPADVCVAPDGSLFVTDWYDPGVGGHAMGDLERGRIFRVTPKGHRSYHPPQVDVTTAAGAVEALKNPNYAVRYLAWTALHEMGTQAQPALRDLFASDNPRHRARALWLLEKTRGDGESYMERALVDADPAIRIVALRMARQTREDDKVFHAVGHLVGDPAPQVRRECAIALHRRHAPHAAGYWTELALQYDGHDRWYLEALGIAAHGQWDTFLETWLARVGDAWQEKPGRDIVWRSRASRTSELLGVLAEDPRTPAEELPRLMRALDFQANPHRHKTLMAIAFDAGTPQYATYEALRRLDPDDISKDPVQYSFLQRFVERTKGTPHFLELIEHFQLTPRFPDVLQVATTQPEDSRAARAIRLLLEHGHSELIDASLKSDEDDQAVRTARALRTARDERAVDMLLDALGDPARELEVRRHAAQALGSTERGANVLVGMLKDGDVDEELLPAAAAALAGARWKGVREEVAKLFPAPAGKDEEPLPSIAVLKSRDGDAARGKQVFEMHGTCNKCHVVRGQGREVGPNLSGIGAKLSRTALLESILYPSAGISHNYASYAMALKSGKVVTGLLMNETAKSVTIRDVEGIDHILKTTDIAAQETQKVSLMPADLQKAMTVQELLDLVEYLGTLRDE
jgi:putative membrane-bound dehydrogenase-like protein